MKFLSKSWLLLVPLVLTLCIACFGYRDTFGEPDMSNVGMGIVYGANWSNHFADRLQYGMSFSFGYYHLLAILMSEPAMHDPAQVAQAVNFTGLFFAALFALSLGLMLDRLLPQRYSAAWVTTAFLFCPVSLPFLASGHPFIGSCACLFLSCWLALLGADRPLPQQLAYLLAAGLSMLLSLTLRGDVALALPFVLAAVWARTGLQPGPQRWRLLTALAVTLGLAFLAFLYLQRPYAADTGGATNTLLDFAAKFIVLQKISKGAVVLVLSFGLLSVPALGWALLYGWRHKLLHQPMLLVWLALGLPSLAFWLANPQPARHFLLPILAMYGIIGTLLAHHLHDLRMRHYLDWRCRQVTRRQLS